MSTPQNAVTAEAGNSSTTIHARVGDSAIDKVTRLFSAGLADIFTETLQNSRRGGANRVAATIEQDGDTTRVTLADDGDGIADPAILLTFGESSWKPGIAEAGRATVGGLVNGTEYTFQVWAVNRVGEGARSEAKATPIPLTLTVVAVSDEVTEGEPVRYRIVMSEKTTGAVVFVKNLRRKLGDDAAGPAYIVNQRGVGYRMARPDDA